MKITCPQCGFSREQNEDRLPADHVVATCPNCGCRFRFSLTQGAGEILPPKGWHSSEDGEEDDIRVIASNAYAREAKRFAQERHSTQDNSLQNFVPNLWAIAPEPYGWGTALWQTIIRIMFQAPTFFQNLKAIASTGRPLAFFLILCIFQTLVEWGYSIAFLHFLAPDVSQDPNLSRLIELATPWGNIFLTVLLRTGVLVVQLYVFSLLMYLAYRVIVRDKATFTVIFQILAYSTAPWILCVIPAIGSIAGTIWSVGCAAVGCKAALRLDWSQTLIGFLPIIFAFIPLLAQVSGMLNQ